MLKSKLSIWSKLRGFVIPLMLILSPMVLTSCEFENVDTMNEEITEPTGPSVPIT